MSMICWVLAITPAQIAAVEAKPQLTAGIVATAEDAATETSERAALARMSPQQRRQYEAQRSDFKSLPGLKEEEVRRGAARQAAAGLGPFDPALDLEKSWHILHYLFTGHVDAAAAPGDALLTGAPIGVDVGYGPARLHRPDACRRFADFLKSVDLARLQARISFHEMNRLGVYAMPWDQTSSEADFDKMLRTEVAWSFPALRTYVATAAAKGDGLLIWLS